MEKGKKKLYPVYIVGAGAGEPDLITVKGKEILKNAETIIYDYLVDKRIFEDLLPSAELICARESGRGKFRQEVLNRLIVKKYKQGRKVVRLKCGDPLLLARAKEELEFLTRNKVPFFIVPGITAASAGSAFLGIPFTSRDISSSVLFITGKEAEGKISSIDWKKLAQLNQTIVIYMGVKAITKISELLIKGGLSPSTPLAAISSAGSFSQKYVIGNLGNSFKLLEKGITHPAIIIIGEVVKLSKKFNWFRKVKKVLYTGISQERYFEDALFFHLPLIKIIPADDYSPLERAIKNIAEFDWLVFSSRFGVLYFFERLFKLKKDVRSLAQVKIAAIGASTAGKLKEYGLKADLIPEIETSFGLLKAFSKIDIREKKILLPRSDIADKGLTQGLSAQGAQCINCVAYKNIFPQDLPEIDFSLFDEIMFTAPSTVRNFKKRYGLPPLKIKISCIGEVTRKEVEKQFNLKCTI